jgi:hypothetical protein
MLLLAFGGRFAEPGWPWVMQDADYGNHWIDFDAIPVHVDGLSGGERRFLLIAASLGGAWPLILNDALPGLDRSLLALVLAAAAHAAGSHQDSVMIERDGGAVGFERVDTLYPWPKPAQSFRVIDGGKD